MDAKSCKKYAKFFKALRSVSEFQKLAKIVAYLKGKTYNAQERRTERNTSMSTPVLMYCPFV